ncbi:MAG: arsenate reductase ArsC, partial [Aquificaceae bacterium]
MNIAFICTGNSARSQMAEAFARKIAEKLGMRLQIYSAGSNPAKEINPFAIEVMKEKNIDLSSQRPKSLEEIPYNKLDIV